MYSKTVPEDVLKIQRVEIYLNDLKERLNELRIQHDEVIHSSVEMIKEIDEVSSTLLSTSSNTTAGENMTKIKKLIMEFESAKETCNKQKPVIVGNHIDIQKILQNFEKLNESHFLKDNLIFLRKARESLEKIDTYLGAGLVDLKKVAVSESIRDKINKLNPNKEVDVEVASKCLSNSEKYDLCKENILSNSPRDFLRQTQKNDEETIVLDELQGNMSKDKMETASNYASCCSSFASLSVCKNSLNGYEGDNDDSEFDMTLAKKKRNSKLI